MGHNSSSQITEKAKSPNDVVIARYLISAKMTNVELQMNLTMKNVVNNILKDGKGRESEINRVVKSLEQENKRIEAKIEIINGNKTKTGPISKLREVIKGVFNLNDKKNLMSNDEVAARRLRGNIETNNKAIASYEKQKKENTERMNNYSNFNYIESGEAKKKFKNMLDVDANVHSKYKKNISRLINKSEKYEHSLQKLNNKFAGNGHATDSASQKQGLPENLVLAPKQEEGTTAVSTQPSLSPLIPKQAETQVASPQPLLSPIMQTQAKTPPPPPPPQTVDSSVPTSGGQQVNGRAALMQSIRQGITLRTIMKNDVKPKEPNVLSARRDATQGTEDDWSTDDD